MEVCVFCIGRQTNDTVILSSYLLLTLALTLSRQVWARITTSRPVVDRIDSWTARLRNVSVTSAVVPLLIWIQTS